MYAYCYIRPHRHSAIVSLPVPQIIDGYMDPFKAKTAKIEGCAKIHSTGLVFNLYLQYHFIMCKTFYTPVIDMKPDQPE